MSLERPQSRSGPHQSPPERELVPGCRHLPEPALARTLAPPRAQEPCVRPDPGWGARPSGGEGGSTQGPPGVSQGLRCRAGGGGRQGRTDLRGPRRLRPGPEVELRAPAGGGVWGGGGSGAGLGPFRGSVGLRAGLDGLGSRRVGAAGAGPGGRGRA